MGWNGICNVADNSKFQFQGFGIWNLEFLCGNISPLTMLKCIGMRNMECGNPHSDFYIPMHFSMVRGGTFRRRQFQFQIYNFGFWNLNCLLQNISPLTMLKCIGMWNVECGFPHSTFESRIFGMWNVEYGFPIPNSKFCNGNWNVDFHIPHSNAL